MMAYVHQAQGTNNHAVRESIGRVTPASEGGDNLRTEMARGEGIASKLNTPSTASLSARPNYNHSGGSPGQATLAHTNDSRLVFSNAYPL